MHLKGPPVVRICGAILRQLRLGLYQGLQGPGILQGEAGVQAIYPGPGHILRLGRPVGVAEHVRPQHHAQQHQHQRRHRRAGQALGQHPQGLAHQHGRRQIAHDAHHGHAYAQPGGAEVAAAAHGHQDIQQHAQGQAAYQSHAQPEHRPHPGKGRRIAGQLAFSPAVQQPGQDRQHQGHGGEDQQGAPALGGQAAGAVGVLYVVLGQLAGEKRRIFRAALAQVADQLIHRRQPPGNDGLDVRHGEAVQQKLRQLLAQPGQRHRQAVDGGVQHRHRQQPPGDHGAQGPQGQEDQVQQGGHHEPRQQGRRQSQAAQQGRKGRHRQHQQVPRRQHGPAGEKVGPEQGSPPLGQGVHGPHGPGLHQIGEHRRGHDAAEDQRQHHGGGVGIGAQLGQVHQGGIPLRGPVPHRDGQEDQPQPHIQEQHRPVAPQVAAGDGPVKE